MTIKDYDNNPPMVAATLVTAEPEVYVGATAPAPIAQGTPYVPGHTVTSTDALRPVVLDSAYVQGTPNPPPYAPGVTAPVYMGTVSGSINNKPATIATGMPTEIPSTPHYPTASTTTAAASGTYVPQTGSVTTTTTTYTVPPSGNQSNPEASRPTTIGFLGRQSCQVTCNYCKHQCVTRTRDRVDLVTILIVIVLLLLFWPLFWLPLVIPCCKTTEHTCGHCNRVVGRTEPCE